MEIVIMDRPGARKASFSKKAPPTAIISITDVQNELNRFHQPTWLKTVLRLQFDDVLEGGVHCITDSDAKTIRDFVLNNMMNVQRIIVHCEAGVSRSAGVAAAIIKALGGDDQAIFNDKRYFPNRTCYQKVWEAFSQGQ